MTSIKKQITSSAKTASDITKRTGRHIKKTGHQIRNRAEDLRLRKIQKWMYCPACGGKMMINKKETQWTCMDCGYSVAHRLLVQGYIFWFCDECNTFLNNQEGFDYHAQSWVCTECGHENGITKADLGYHCKRCGCLLPDDYKHGVCPDCYEAIKERRVERLEEFQELANAVSQFAYTLSDAIAPKNGDSDCDSSEELDNAITENDNTSGFDFDRWYGVLDEDNHADEYYKEDEVYQYCYDCFNLMVPIGNNEYKCPVCGRVQEADYY